MTTPSELAQSINAWANDNDVTIFSTEDVYNALDYIDHRKDVSEALRYMFKKGIVGRDRKDAKGFWYAFADVAPDHFEFYDADSPMAYHIKNVESKEIHKAIDGAIKTGSGFVRLTASESGISTENISPEDFWDTGDEIKSHEPEEIENVTTGYAQVEEIKEASNAEADDIESIDLTTSKWRNQICVDPETIKLFSDQEAQKNTANDLSNNDIREIANDSLDDISKQEIWHKMSSGYNAISNSQLPQSKITEIDLSQALWQTENLLESADSIQIGGDHYKKMAIQPWNALKEWMTEEQFNGFLKGSAIVYLARCDSKGGMDDIKKARHCLDKLIEVSEKGE